MMVGLRLTLTLALVVVLYSLAAINTAPAQAAPPLVPTVLVIEPPPPSRTGEPAEVTVRLADTAGRPVADATIEGWLDGALQDKGRTDANGVALLKLPRDLPAGVYRLTAAFNGRTRDGLQPSQASTQVTINAAVLEIETIPALPSVEFALTQVTVAAPGSQSAPSRSLFTSDKDGIARIEVTQPGTYRLEVLPWNDEEKGIYAEFNRWGDNVFTDSREVDVSGTRRLQVGFKTSYLVSLVFVDLAGSPVDRERVTSVTLSNSIGERRTYSDFTELWLLGSRTVRRRTGLENTEVLYSVESVQVEGANTVYRSQQRFYPAQEREWSLQLLLYSARITARDALFGFPIGSAVRLEYPDGRVEHHPFGPNAEVTLQSLPRGDYRVSVDGPGVSFTRPVALSRNQEVSLEVISYLDILVVLILAAAIFFGLLFAGRPYLLTGLHQLTAALAGKRRTSPPQEGSP